ncbi:Peroxiredoxin [hydrothermal vent metagenome]|uniref:Peroxiredoxin n=1 Tax=hydrothermal vent metagenome TaxID=652676 RepID=A0A3B0XXX2_9ZZZZ
MRLQSGQPAPEFKLFNINGEEFNTQDLKGKRYLLTFYRFASCPFCNLRVHQLTKQYAEYNDTFEVIAVFDSTLENLQKYAIRHQPPFPVLADKDNNIHRLYHIEHSISGVVKGIILRFPALILSIFKGYIPWRIKGDITGMPADFLVDENGIINSAYYGNDEGDHIPLHRVKQYANRLNEIAVNLQEI